MDSLDEGWSLHFLAPDAASAKAARGLTGATQWPVRGHNEAAVWGECQGSGAKPYQTQVDLGGPAFRCSCPSRKFPCKHGLALLLMRAENATGFGSGEPPAWVADWLASRVQRAQKSEARETERATERATDPQAAAVAATHKPPRPAKPCAGGVSRPAWTSWNAGWATPSSAAWPTCRLTRRRSGSTLPHAWGMPRPAPGNPNACSLAWAGCNWWWRPCGGATTWARTCGPTCVPRWAGRWIARRCWLRACGSKIAGPCWAR
jgi:hypothetical protein